MPAAGFAIVQERVAHTGCKPTVRLKLDGSTHTSCGILYPGSPPYVVVPPNKRRAVPKRLPIRAIDWNRDRVLHRDRPAWRGHGYRVGLRRRLIITLNPDLIYRWVRRRAQEDSTRAERMGIDAVLDQIGKVRRPWYPSERSPANNGPIPIRRMQPIEHSRRTDNRIATGQERHRQLHRGRING